VRGFRAVKTGSLEKWLDRHGVDILCLQEVKATENNIGEKPKDHGAKPDGWDTFWCPSPSVGPFKGFNGVATYARKGLTAAADSAPLGVAALDAEGRCVMTDHGSFVLFNVYVPNDGPGSVRLPVKMQFLNALRTKMQWCVWCDLSSLSAYVNPRVAPPNVCRTPTGARRCGRSSWRRRL
jgi:exonuclease III